MCTSDGRHPSGEAEEEEGPRRYICGSEGKRKLSPARRTGKQKFEKELPGIIESECLFDKSMSEYGRRIPHPLIPFDNLRANHAFVLPRADQTLAPADLGDRKEGGSYAVAQPHAHTDTAAATPEQIPRIPHESHPQNENQVDFFNICTHSSMQAVQLPSCRELPACR